jgi:hypothetical protein
MRKLLFATVALLAAVPAFADTPITCGGIMTGGTEHSYVLSRPVLCKGSWCWAARNSEEAALCGNADHITCGGIVTGDFGDDTGLLSRPVLCKGSWCWAARNPEESAICDVKPTVQKPKTLQDWYNSPAAHSEPLFPLARRELKPGDEGYGE